MSSGNAGQPLDSELDLRMIAVLTAGLLVLVAVLGLLMWWFSIYLRDQRRAADPPPPMLIEARMPYRPPAPRLQAEPFQDLEELRAAEESQLLTYGWIDEAGGVARIPIERAMELTVENGLLQTAGTAEPAAPAVSSASPGRETLE
jgi:hypothetical protein